MTEQELEERISDMIDNHYEEMAERFESESITRKVSDAILALEIDQLKKAVEQVECVGNVVRIQTHEQA